MTYLATTLWPWLAAAGLLGVLVGAATARGRRPVAVRRGGLVLDLVAWTVAALLSVGVAAAILHWVDGRHGLWLDMTLAMTGLYVLGCAVGAVLRRVATGAPAGAGTTPERATGEPAAEERPVPPLAAAALPSAEPPEGPTRADAGARQDGEPAPAEPSTPEPAAGAAAVAEKADADMPVADRSEGRKIKAGKAKSRQPAGGKTRVRAAKPAEAAPEAGTSPSDLPADTAASAARPRRPRGKAAGEGASRSRPRGKPKG